MTSQEPPHLQVPIGGIAAIRAPGMLSTLLGSCVGLVVQDMRNNVVALAHVVRAHGLGAGTGPGYFANQAFPRTCDEAIRLGAAPGHLVIRLAGGGQMMGGDLNIGAETIAALRDACNETQIVFGGMIKGPRDGGCYLTVDAATGRATVRPLQNQTVDDSTWRSLARGSSPAEERAR